VSNAVTIFHLGHPAADHAADFERHLGWVEPASVIDATVLTQRVDRVVDDVLDRSQGEPAMIAAPPIPLSLGVGHQPRGRGTSRSTGIGKPALY
jgi:hypothetical protein